MVIMQSPSRAFLERCSGNTIRENTMVTMVLSLSNHNDCRPFLQCPVITPVARPERMRNSQVFALIAAISESGLSMQP